MTKLQPVIPDGFPQPPEELLGTGMRHYKVNVCRNFKPDVHRSCPYGIKCHFAHGQHEQRSEGYGPTPEEATKSGNYLSPELIAWWRSARKEMKRQQHGLPCQPRAANSPQAPSQEAVIEDEELKMLREQFPEEFQQMKVIEQQEQWQPATRHARRSAAGTEPVSPPAQPQQPASTVSPSVAQRQHKSPAPTPAAAAPPPAKPQQAQPPARYTHAPPPPPPPRPNLVPDTISPPSTIAQVLIALSQDLRTFLALPEASIGMNQAQWPALAARQSQYRNLGVEMANQIVAISSAVEALQQGSDGGRDSTELNRLQSQLAAAEQEYLELAPLFAEMNKLGKQGKKRADAAAAATATTTPTDSLHDGYNRQLPGFKLAPMFESQPTWARESGVISSGDATVRYMAAHVQAQPH